MLWLSYQELSVWRHCIGISIVMGYQPLHQHSRDFIMMGSMTFFSYIKMHFSNVK